MKARPEPGINVEIGGFVVKLVCHDPMLHRRVKSSFHCLSDIAASATPGSSRPAYRSRFGAGRCQKSIMTLAVHSSASMLRTGFDLTSGKLLDGEGEYVAALNPAARHGVIRLTGLPGHSATAEPGSDATLALANFIRRIFTRLVIDHNGAVFHCACVVRNGAAHLFFGKSGSGKSTVCELSRGDTIASDDLTVVRVVSGRMLAWGLPAFRSPPYQLSQGVFPIRAAFTLVQDSRNFIKRLGAASALAGLLTFPSDLSEPEQVGKIIDLLTRLVHTVPCYELHFSKDPMFWNAIDAELTDQVQGLGVHGSQLA